MATPSTIVDPDTRQSAKVTKFGQLIVAPIDYSDASAHDMDVISTAFNFITPSQDKSIVITDIIASANNNVSNTAPADIVIFEASSAVSITPLDIIVRPQLTRSNNFILTGLNLLTPPGRWVNATTTDNDILLTIMFYRVPV